MKNNQNWFITAFLVLCILGILFLFFKRDYDFGKNVDIQEMMSLAVYIQDKEIAYVSDCGATKKVIYEVPKTFGVADASLKILFEKELAQYGTYKSVKIEDGVAKVLIDRKFISLASCESAHLTSVITDTLTQYESARSIELQDENGKIEF